MIKIFSLVFAALLVTLIGCVHYSYEGSSFAPTEVAAIYSNPKAVPQKYEVMGRAVVYGDYQDVSLDKLKAKLTTEAAANGADAVLITSNRVVPSGEAVTVAPIVASMEATGAENTYNMNQLQRDFDGGYGEVGKKGTTKVIQEYRRIIRAEYLRYISVPKTAPAKPTPTPPQGK